MTQCPTCKLAMESHSTSELMECCIKQIGDKFVKDGASTCPNCRHDIKRHTDKELAECTIEFLRADSSFR